MLLRRPHLCHYLLNMYGVHRTLHSFPTRRSSDLDRVAFLDGQCPAGHEAVLDVDDEEDVGRRRLELPPRGLGERRGCAGGQLGDDQSGRSLLEELAPIACLHGTKTPFPVVWVSKSR